MLMRPWNKFSLFFITFPLFNMCILFLFSKDIIRNETNCAWSIITCISKCVYFFIKRVICKAIHNNVMNKFCWKNSSVFLIQVSSLPNTYVIAFVIIIRSLRKWTSRLYYNYYDYFKLFMLDVEDRKKRKNL